MAGRSALAAQPWGSVGAPPQASPDRSRRTFRGAAGSHACAGKSLRVLGHSSGTPRRWAAGGSDTPRTQLTPPRLPLLSPSLCLLHLVRLIHSLHRQPASQVPILYQASWRDTAVTKATIKSFPSDLMTLSALQRRSPGARRTCVREC